MARWINCSIAQLPARTGRYVRVGYIAAVPNNYLYPGVQPGVIQLFNCSMAQLPARTGRYARAGYTV